MAPRETRRSRVRSTKTFIGMNRSVADMTVETFSDRMSQEKARSLEVGGHVAARAVGNRGPVRHGGGARRHKVRLWRSKQTGPRRRRTTDKGDSMDGTMKDKVALSREMPMSAASRDGQSAGCGGCVAGGSRADDGKVCKPYLVYS
ncbi:uncharacterized protein VDAG_00655 [Verticillium dahliae VdLs.17]|uniref:Uncharacterized protein n=1 Tax=Verticillium dahliae (strain VdLs.17 / ATCC MYA-4575 / FGSC 10137) TaxID=498257 RepID=G2WQL3_VERDV|nr:uncharacterized protein VDAG_00655 [Verticillium dahliae VdLs.17]EGY13973.1 hypothetical protein VDAG_00655 [Verticillium dahliae VdLs.17]KAH6710450.1 hypothetical protein EV126DRAFT_407499 [Verticillium dahliae]